MIEILSTGIPNSIQDLGRTGALNQGISRGGAMDRYSHSLANLLVGNDENAATIEVALFPFKLRFGTAVQFACTGADCRITLGDRAVPGWWSRTAEAGETLVIEAPRRGARAYVAIRGGVQVAQVLGSRSTDLKSGFGGFGGRGLRRGDAIEVDQCASTRQFAKGFGILPAELPHLLNETARGTVRVRVIRGAEFEKFTEQARHAFLGEEYVVTPDSNRMGYRLQGTPLPLTSPLELLSHGIVPGTIQVPPSGLPIIQLAEANTCGGYPKLGSVISADLWRLAQTPVGCKLKFELVDTVAAVTALSAQLEERRRLLRDIPLVLARG